MLMVQAKMRESQLKEVRVDLLSHEESNTLAPRF